jgi:PAS domain-containing protein
MFNSDSQSSDNRRSTRVPLETSIEVSIEVDGKPGTLPFKGVTVTVNLHGALIRTVKPLEIGATVHLRTLNGEECAAKVVHRLPTNALTYGIELLEPKNVWGVSLPPEDWAQEPDLPEPAQSWSIVKGTERMSPRLKRAYVSPTINHYHSLEQLPEKIRGAVEEILSDDRPLTVVLDEDHRYVSVSEEFARLLGYSARELIGKRVDDITVQGTVDIDFAFQASKRLGEMQGLWLFEGRFGKKLLCRYRTRRSKATYTAELEPLFIAA